MFDLKCLVLLMSLIVSIQFIGESGIKGVNSFGHNVLKQEYSSMYHLHTNFTIPSKSMLYPLTADPLLDGKVDDLKLVRRTL